jgi:hypothetical protein
MQELATLATYYLETFNAEYFDCYSYKMQELYGVSLLMWFWLGNRCPLQ